jgi:hypothetical protein
MELVRALGDAPPTAPLVREARRESVELEALLRRSGDRVTPGDGEDARFRLFDAVLGLLRRAATAAPLLLVLDDLHAADPASLDLLVFVARGLRGAPTLLLGTTRDATFASEEAISERLTRVAREAVQLPLGRLRRDDVAEWVALATPALVERADRIFESSEGNPLFVEELLVAWQKAPNTAALPRGIRSAIRAHLDLVSVPTRAVLAVGAVLGRDVPLDLLSAVAEVPAPELEAGVDEACEVAIVEPAGEGRVRFCHALLRDELQASLSPARRAELHHAAARRLARDDAEIRVAAHHALLGAAAGDATEVAHTVLAAVRDALGRFAFADAAILAERALRVLGERVPPELEDTLHLRLGESWILSGEYARGRAECARAADRALARGNAELLARAALAYTDAAQQRLGRDVEGERLLRRALADLDPSEKRLRARLMSHLSSALVPPTPEEGDEPLRLAKEALALAREAGDDETICVPLCAMLNAFSEHFPIGDRFAAGSEALSLARRYGQLPRAMPLVGGQVACWLQLGRLDGAWNELEAAEKIFAGMPPRYRWRGPLLRAMLLALEGRTDEAWDLSLSTLRRTEEEAIPEGVLHASIQLMGLPYMGGDARRYAEVDAAVTRVVASVPGGAMFACFADATAGRLHRVRDAIALARTLDLRAIPGAAQLGWAVLQAGLVEHAEPFYALAAASAEQTPLAFAPGHVATFGPTALLAARLAMLLGRGAEARTHLARAQDLSERLRSPVLLAKVRAARDELGGEEERASVRPSLGAPPSPRLSAVLGLERRGELWALSADGREILLKDGRGLRYLEALVNAPHREVHVLELTGGDDGDAGPVLDERAKRELRARAEELRAELDDATASADLGRAERAREELEMLGDELARAVGLGGRDKRAASGAERARINVQRRLRDVVRRATEQDRELGRHLELSLKTGVFCRYAPTWPGAER